MAYEEGDSIGLLCLTPAGEISGENTSCLEDYFKEENPKAVGCLRSLLNPDQKDWYATIGAPMSYTEYWTEAYPWLSIGERARTVKDFIKMDSTELSLKLDGDRLLLPGGMSLSFPSNVFSNPVFQRQATSCIIHGDLHGGNVIVDQGCRCILIDYRNVAIGPRCVDFAALESSVRLSNCKPCMTPAEIELRIRQERFIKKTVWIEDFRGPDDRLVFWQRCSIEIGRLARANFPGLEAPEYWAACIMWVCRILASPRFDDSRKRVLAAWASELAYWIGHE